MKRKAMRKCWHGLARDVLALAMGLRPAVMLDYIFEPPSILRQLLQQLHPELAILTGASLPHAIKQQKAVVDPQDLEQAPLASSLQSARS